MENFLANIRIYLLVMVFFISCFLGITTGVSLPVLAIRSIIITVIVAIFSRLFIKYVASVIKTVPLSEELDQDHNSVPPKVNQSVNQNNK